MCIAEARLQLGVLVRLLSTTLAFASRFKVTTSRGLPPAERLWTAVIPDDLARLDAVGDLFLDDLDGGLVGDLGDDDLATRRCAARRSRRRRASSPSRARSGRRRGCPAGRGSAPPVGKSGPLTNCIRSSGVAVGVLEQVQRRVDDLAEVVRRDVGRHADGDALASR